MPIDMKAAICRSASELLTKKRTKKLTVKDIVEECGITRQTFYYHFQDMDEVLEWTILEKSKQMLEQSIQAEEPEKALRVFVSFLQEKCRTDEKIYGVQETGPGGQNID